MSEARPAFRIRSGGIEEGGVDVVLCGTDCATGPDRAGVVVHYTPAYVRALERALFEIAHRGDAWSARRALVAMEGD